MSFTYSSLFFTWLLPLMALPVLIHLINLLRRRRIPWAAMAFLQESRKKNQNWIRLKQLLLLLARMAAVALVVFMMAGPLLKDQWSRLFGDGTTHHLILLDDSGSMADRWSDTSAFDRGRDVVRNLVARAERQPSKQFVTLLRFSQAAAGQAPEISRTQVTAEYNVEFESYQSKLSPSQLAVGPLEALAVAEKLLSSDEHENAIVYVVSDLRSPQWQDAMALKDQIQRLTEKDAQLQLVHCVDTARPNLAITDLVAMPGQQATDVLIRMEVEVTNFGTQIANQVPVQLQKRIYADGDDEIGTTTTLGAVKIDRIQPAKSVRRSFDITFDRAGFQEVTARIPSDPIAADNQRFAVVEILQDVPVLIINGSGPDDPIFLKSALAPSGRIRTGLKPRIESPAVLRDQSLDEYHAVFVVNLAHFDPVEIEALENYVRNGGGVAFFTGDATQSDMVNKQLYREGEGLFPVALATPSTLLVDRLETAPDVTVDHEHPIFRRIFGDKVNTWQQNILVERYFALARNNELNDNPNVTVIAQLRNGAPLIVEKKFGKGRVLAVLMTSSPLWHNWGLANPTFPIAMLETQVYLGANQLTDVARQVGQRLTIPMAGSDYLPDVTLTLPGAIKPYTLNSQAKPSADSSDLELTVDDTQYSGVYQATLRRIDGETEAHRFAYNVPSIESDLRTMFQPQLTSLLGDVPFEYHDATELLAPAQEQAGFALAEQWWFFIVLIGLLVVEQLLAYSATYHPPLTGGTRR